MITMKQHLATSVLQCFKLSKSLLDLIAQFEHTNKKAPSNRNNQNI